MTGPPGAKESAITGQAYGFSLAGKEKSPAGRAGFCNGPRAKTSSVLEAPFIGILLGNPARPGQGQLGQRNNVKRS